MRVAGTKPTACGTPIYVRLPDVWHIDRDSKSGSDFHELSDRDSRRQTGISYDTDTHVILVADTTFTDFMSSEAPGVLVERYSRLWLDHVTFRNMALFPPDPSTHNDSLGQDYGTAVHANQDLLVSLVRSSLLDFLHPISVPVQQKQQRCLLLTRALFAPVLYLFPHLCSTI